MIPAPNPLRIADRFSFPFFDVRQEEVVMRAAGLARASPFFGGWMLVLVLGELWEARCFAQQPRAEPDIPAVEHEQSEAKEDFGGANKLRQAQREGLAEGVRWAILGVFIPLVVAIIVALILLYT